MTHPFGSLTGALCFARSAGHVVTGSVPAGVRAVHSARFDELCACWSPNELWSTELE